MQRTFPIRAAMPFTVAAVALTTAFVSRPAQADFEFFTNQGAYASRLSALNYNQDKENVLFNQGFGGTGMMIQGRTNQSSHIIDFTGNELIKASGGQARIKPVDGAFTSLLITPNNPLFSFRALELNPDDVRNIGGDITLRVLGASTGATQAFGNGQNFIGIIATGSDSFRTAELISSVPNAIEEVKQVRVVLGQNNTNNPPGGVIPEPGTYTLIASGLLPLAGVLLRRRRTIR